MSSFYFRPVIIEKFAYETLQCDGVFYNKAHNLVNKQNAFSANISPTTLGHLSVINSSKAHY